MHLLRSAPEAAPEEEEEHSAAERIWQGTAIETRSWVATGYLLLTAWLTTWSIDRSPPNASSEKNMSSATASAPAMLVSHDPATGEAVGSVPITPEAEVAAVVATARAAQPAWQALGHEGRADLLTRACQGFLERAEELGTLVTREMGKPLAEGIGEAKSLAHGVAEHLEEIGGALAAEHFDDGRNRSTVYHDALGVCAAITPWNFPLSMPHWMVLPALAAGNSVVLKPSEETALCGQAYVDVLNEVLPAGVLQVVQGADDQGKALVASDVDMIAFTGSAEVGKLILRAASGSLKRVILELGGKDPMIVLASADLARAAKFAALNSFRNAGQVCVSTERIFVPESIADEFETRLVEAAQAMTQGNGLDEGVRVGPMVNARQRDHVLQQLNAAVEQGASVLSGGEGHRDNFITPTVLGGITEDMSIAKDETFGPVACVTRVSSEDEAIRLANDTHFGLGAVVFGADDDHTESVARQLTAGMIGINKAAGGAEGTPWVGARQSGYGFHKSKDGHRQFTQTRVVTRPVPRN
jgi:acyl-CoA reductase-like NAD-dependent aldehyde dehydrogenase